MNKINVTCVKIELILGYFLVFNIDVFRRMWNPIIKLQFIDISLERNRNSHFILEF